MEFKSLRNIESSFRQIRLFGIVFLSLCAVVTVWSVWNSYRFAEKQREKIYVLDNGKSLMLALSQDLSQNRPAEAREHVRRFHEMFFTLSPEKSAIEHNVKRALLLADKSVYHYYSDFAEKGYYNRIIAGNINHELKTPVAAIQGYLETLLANPSLDAQRRTDFLKKSAAQTERLRRLLADISTITRMDEASQLIQKERVVLNDLIAEVTADMELKPADQRLRVNIDFPQQVEIVGSPSLLASIFRNLADNAAAYSGGRDIFIRLLSDTPEECTVSFADNGIGIGEEHLPHIFERFYRIDKGRSRKQGGTGLGLAIVKNAVAIHGGTITARERERGGLEFIFTLKKHS